MKLYQKILLALLLPIIIIIALLIMLLNSTFGNYTSSVYGVMLNFILCSIYILLSLVFIKVSNEFVQVKKLYFALLIPFVFMFISYLHGKNLYKDVIVEAKIENYDDFSSIVIFDNGTFEFKRWNPHSTDHIKGTYSKNANVYRFNANKYLKTEGYILVNDKNAPIFKSKP